MIKTLRVVAAFDVRYEQGVVVVQLDAWIGARNAMWHNVVLLLSRSLVPSWTIHNYLSSTAVYIIRLLLLYH
jgi:hypothetical protein